MRNICNISLKLLSIGALLFLANSVQAQNTDKDKDQPKDEAPSQGQDKDKDQPKDEAPSMCWKMVTGRGVGTIPGNCGPGQQKSLALCYLKCKPGFFMSDALTGTCQQECPQGWGQTVAHCTKPSSYGRGEYANTWADWNKDKCEAQAKAQGKAGCEKWGAMWYHKCKPGFHAVGCCVCSPDCPAGMADIGVGCTKNNYTLPPITPSCGPGEDYDAGLCYKKCGANQNGVGPLCWNKCPEGMVDCGAVCGKTAMACITGVGELVFATGKAAVELGMQVKDAVDTLKKGLGTPKAKEDAKKAIEKGAESLKDSSKRASVEILKKFAGKAIPEVKKLVSLELSSKNPKLSKKDADDLADMQVEPEKFDFIGYVSGLDPSKVKNLFDSLQAFTKNPCK